MRYHSVFMQTILNGNNFILDYTDTKSGKISGFIKFIKAESFYSNRTVQLQGRSSSFNSSEIVKTLAANHKYSFQYKGTHEKYKSFIMQCLK